MTHAGMQPQLTLLPQMVRPPQLSMQQALMGQQMLRHPTMALPPGKIEHFYQ